MAKIWGQLDRAQLENVSADPSVGVKGRAWFNYTDGISKYDDGSLVQALLSVNGSVTDNTVPRFHGTVGKVQSTALTIDDNGNFTHVNSYANTQILIDFRNSSNTTGADVLIRTGVAGASTLAGYSVTKFTGTNVAYYWLIDAATNRGSISIGTGASGPNGDTPTSREDILYWNTVGNIWIGPSAGDQEVNLNGSVNPFALSDTDPSSNGQIGYDSVNGFLGYHNGAIGPLGGDVSMKILDNGDGTITVKSGSRWMDGIVRTNAADITSTAADYISGNDSVLQNITSGLFHNSSTDLTNYIYWDTVDGVAVAIADSTDDDLNKYNNTDRVVNTVRYKPLGEVVMSASDTVASITNYPIASVDSLNLVAAADGWQAWTPTFSASGTLTYSSTTIYFARYRRVGNSVEFNLSVTGTTGVSSASDTIYFTLPIAPKNLGSQSTEGSFTARVTDSSAVSGYAFYDESTVAIGVRKYDDSNWALGSGRLLHVSGVYEVAASNGFNVISLPSSDFNLSTANLSISSHAPTASDAVGTIYLYEYQTGSSNTQTLVTAADQTTSGMNTNGIRLYSRVYGGTNTSGQPGRVGIKLGSIDPRSIQIFGYGSSGKTNPVDFTLVKESTSEYGCRHGYDRSTGVLYLDVSLSFSTSTANRRVGLQLSDNVAPTDGYFEAFASSVQPLVGLPNGRFEKKKLSADVTTNTTLFTFSNLTIGRTYEVMLNAMLDSNNGSRPTIDINHNSVIIGSVAIDSPTSQSYTAKVSSGGIIFTAAATTLTITSTNFDSNNFAWGNDNFEETWAQLKELPVSYGETTVF